MVDASSQSGPKIKREEEEKRKKKKKKKKIFSPFSARQERHLWGKKREKKRK
jgi:hypothetical protein